MNIDISKLYDPRILEKNNDTSEIDEILEQEEILYVISKNIIEYRKENNITQQQLAEKIDMNQTMISKLESGKYNPTFKEIYKITRKLTKSTNLYNKILQEIINNLKEYESLQYNVFIVNEQKEKTQDIEELYISNNQNNIISLELKRTNNKGEKNYGEYQSKISIVG